MSLQKYKISSEQFLIYFRLKRFLKIFVVLEIKIEIFFGNELNLCSNC